MSDQVSRKKPVQEQINKKVRTIWTNAEVMQVKSKESLFHVGVLNVEQLGYQIKLQKLQNNMSEL